MARTSYFDEEPGSAHESPTSEREEALWGQVVLLQYRIDKLTKDLALRDEMIGLLREKLALEKPVRMFPSAKTVKKEGERKKCDYPPCATQVPKRQRYCSQSHSLKHRWECTRMARAPKQGVDHADNAISQS